jgi:hypothetical protein
MPDEALDQVLRLVADGRLTAAEAEPILAALDETASRGRQTGGRAHAEPGDGATAGKAVGGREGRGPGCSQNRPDTGRQISIEVRDGSRTVVNLRLPVSLGRYALDRVPGLSGDQVARVRQALDSGMTGPVLSVDDEHSSVRITVE